MREQIEIIREAVRSGEISQNRLASLAGLTHRTVGRLLEDGGSNPTLATVEALHTALMSHRAGVTAAAGEATA